jgi:hypothetical protein
MDDIDSHVKDIINLKLLNIIKKYPNKEWDWLYITMRMSWNIIISNPEHPWNWRCICDNPDISWDNIMLHPCKPDYLNETDNVDWKKIKKSIGNKLNWINDDKIVNNIINDIINSRGDYIEDFHVRSNILSQFIKFNAFVWYSIFKNISLDLIYKYDILNTLNNIIEPPTNDHSIKWCYCGLSINPNITWDIVKNNPQIRWSWFHLSFNKNISLDVKLNNNTKQQWWIGVISSFESIDWEFIKNNPQIKWSSDGVSRNPNITYDIVKSYPQYGWNMFNVFRNDSIKLNDIKKFKPDELSFEGLSFNNNLTIEYFEQNIDNSWLFNDIVFNEFRTDYNIEKERLINKYKLINYRLEKRVSFGCKHSKTIESKIKIESKY